MKSKTLSLIFLTLTIVTVAIMNADAQKFYINLDGSYGFNASSASYGNASTYLATNVTMPGGVTGNYYLNSGETGHTSLATGVNIGGIIGYNICKHFNVEVGCYSVAANTESYNLSNIFYNEYSNYYTDNWKASMVKIVPAIKLTCDSAKWIPYMKFGMAIGFISSMTNDETGVESNTIDILGNPVINTNTSEVITKFTGSATIGFMAALGIDYSLNERFGFFAEVNYTGMSWAPTKSVITSSTANGVSNLSDYSPYQIQTNYTNTYTPPSSPSTINVNQPTTELKQYYPFSTWGFNIGVKFSFGKKSNMAVSQ